MLAMVHSQILVPITIVFLVIIIPSGVILTTASYYFGTTSLAYDQTNQMNLNTINLLNIPIKKVHVGDIDIAYKAFGKVLLLMNLSLSSIVIPRDGGPLSDFLGEDTDEEEIISVPVTPYSNSPSPVVPVLTPYCRNGNPKISKRSESGAKRARLSLKGYTKQQRSPWAGFRS